MGMKNGVTLVGNIYHEIGQCKYGQSGVAYISNKVAINDSDERGAEFVQFTAFGKVAESFAKYCKKGQQIGIDGHITGSFKTVDGRMKHDQQVIADRIHYFQFIKEVQDSASSVPKQTDGAKSGGQGYPSPQPPPNANAVPIQSKTSSPSVGVGIQDAPPFVDIADDDLPF